MNQIETVVQKQKEFFATQQTRDNTFRINALKKLKSNMKEMENEILDALYKDLRKS